MRRHSGVGWVAFFFFKAVENVVGCCLGEIVRLTVTEAGTGSLFGVFTLCYHIKVVDDRLERIIVSTGTCHSQLHRCEWSRDGDCRL